LRERGEKGPSVDQLVSVAVGVELNKAITDLNRKSFLDGTLYSTKSTDSSNFNFSSKTVIFNLTLTLEESLGHFFVVKLPSKLVP